MKPKEKAKELYDKFYMAIPSDEMGLSDEASRQCALIAVDEILAIFYDDIQSMWNDELSYWHQVKQEIENL